MTSLDKNATNAFCEMTRFDVAFAYMLMPMPVRDRRRVCLIDGCITRLAYAEGNANQMVLLCKGTCLSEMYL